METGMIPDESDLCVSCGMCCDGTYLAWAPVVDSDDITGLQSVNHPVEFSEPRGTHFTLPCPALVDKCCTVYGHRPAICPTYRCDLLNRYAAGGIAKADALAAISDTLAARDKVRPALYERLGVTRPTSMFTLYEALDAERDGAADPGASRAADSDLMADIGLLNYLLSKHFRTLPGAKIEPADGLDVTQA